MSWCGGGEISVTPGVAWRSRAISSETLKPGSCPPSPGFAPWAILISISRQWLRYSAVTPKRAEAICLVAEEALSPLSRGSKRSRASPPSPLQEAAPMRFMAMASVSCASLESAPCDMLPLEKRLRTWVIDSTSSSPMGARSDLKSSRLRMWMGGSA